MRNLYTNIVKKIDLTEYSEQEGHVIFDVGLEELIRFACDQTAKGWSFVEAKRNEANPAIVHMHFKRDWNE